MRVRWTPTALRDLDEIWLRIATESLAAADRLIDDIIATADHLSLFPSLGRSREDLGRPSVRSEPPCTSGDEADTERDYGKRFSA